VPGEPATVAGRQVVPLSKDTDTVADVIGECEPTPS